MTTTKTESAPKATQAGLGRQTLITGTGLALNGGLAFVMTWLVGRYYGADGAGQFFLLTSIFMITTSVLGMGADTAAMRFLARAEALDQPGRIRHYLVAALTPVIIIGLLVAATAFIFAPHLVRALDLDPSFVSIVRALAVVLVPSMLLDIILGACRGLGDVYTYTTLRNLFVPIARVCFVVAGIAAGHGVTSALWAWLVPPAVGGALAAWRLGHVLRQVLNRLSDSPRESRALAEDAVDLWKFSLPRGIGIILERGMDWADVLIVISLLGTAAGGVYGTVSRIVMASAMIETALSVVLGPRISATIARDEHMSFSELFNTANRYLVLTAWPLMITIAVFAHDVLRVFGPQFVSGATALRILCAGMLVATAVGLIQTVLLMAGRSVWQVVNRVVRFIILVGLSLALVPVMGIAGAALAWAVGIVVDAAMAAYQVHSMLNVRRRLTTLLSDGLPAVLIFGIGGLITLTTVPTLLGRIVAMSVLSAAYVAVLWMRESTPGGRFFGTGRRAAA